MSSKFVASLRNLVGEGRMLLERPPNWPNTKEEFRRWEDQVVHWLDELSPSGDLSAEFVALEGPTVENCFATGDRSGIMGVVRSRLGWLGKRTLPRSPPGEHRPTGTPLSDRVFVVHGRDDGLKGSVARLLDRLDLVPVILHEQPNKGRTIIEKFEDECRDVGFAVVLLTPDDKGGLATGSPEAFRFRARQNVILELGFFLARLGRKRVCALYKKGVELPSDYEGVLFLPADDRDGWHLELAKELKEAGVRVDLNRLVRAPD